MKLVTILNTLNLTDAHMQRSRLEAAGFTAIVKNELSAMTLDGYTLAAGGIQVQVPEDQVESARALLSEPDPLSDEV